MYTSFFNQLRLISKSKICVSIWKTLIKEQEDQWNAKTLQLMNSFDVVQWIRDDLYTKFNQYDFDVEIFVQILLDKEINGKELNKNTFKITSVLEWFNDWNNHNKDYSQRIDIEVGNHIAALFVAEITQRKLKDKKNKSAPPGAKKFSIPKLNDLLNGKRKLVNNNR